MIEHPKTTQNEGIMPVKMKGKIPQRYEESLRDLVGQESLNNTCEKLEMAVGNSYLDVDNWDFLNNEA